jgi:hypothetical protein
MPKPHNTSSDVVADEGEVVVDGPDGVHYSMTPEAAADTSDKLAHGAAMAAGQRQAKRADEEDRRRSA